MGILYLLLLTSLISCIEKHFDRKGRGYDLLLLPLSGMLSDWTENFPTWILLLGYPYVSRTAVLVESVCTTLKFTFPELSVVSAVILFFTGPAGKCRKQKTSDPRRKNKWKHS